MSRPIFCPGCCKSATRIPRDRVGPSAGIGALTHAGEGPSLRPSFGLLAPPHKDKHGIASECKDQYDRKIFEHEPRCRLRGESARVMKVSSGERYHRCWVNRVDCAGNSRHIDRNHRSDKNASRCDEDPVIRPFRWNGRLDMDAGTGVAHVTPGSRDALATPPEKKNGPPNRRQPH
jgi:hypothetical protein